MRLGFIGAGRMGRPMVSRLITAGYEVRVLARSEQARTALAGEGAHTVADAVEAGDGAVAVLVCVYTDDQVRDVCLGTGLLEAMPGGSILVVHTTGSPRTAEAVAARAALRGVYVVDSPVSGGPHDIAAGHVTLFVGGADEAVERIRPVLGCYGDPVLHVGPLGAGQRVKLVNNALFAAQIGLLADAVRLGARLGVDEAVLLGALPYGSASSRALAGAAGRGSVIGFIEVVRGFLSKDVAAVHDVAAELGVSLGALDDAIRASAGGLSGPGPLTGAR